MEQAETEALQGALEAARWRECQKQLSLVPTSIPPHASGQQIVRAVNHTRVVADLLIEASSFRTAFEKAFATRRALLRIGVCEWALRALQNFRTFTPVVARLSSVLGVLGTGADERTQVGRTGAVDELTKLWHRYPSCVEIVSALVSLCCGHIDNISRVMRQRGLSVAVSVLTGPASLESPDLLRQTLLLVGLCAICTPDRPDEASALTPALTVVLEALNDRKMSDVAMHAVSAFGNIGDCWMKESSGYKVPDPQRLVNALTCAWLTDSKSLDMATAATWAFSTLLTGHEAIRLAVKREGKDKVLAAIAGEFEAQSTTVSNLRHQLCADVQEAQTQESRSESAEPSTCARSIDSGSRIHAALVIVTDESEQHGSKTASRRTRAGAKRARNIRDDRLAEAPLQRDPYDTNSHSSYESDRKADAEKRHSPPMHTRSTVRRPEIASDDETLMSTPMSVQQPRKLRQTNERKRRRLAVP